MTEQVPNSGFSLCPFGADRGRTCNRWLMLAGASGRAPPAPGTAATPSSWSGARSTIACSGDPHPARSTK